MNTPTLFLDGDTGISIQVRNTFEEMLAPEIRANIADVSVSYNALNDSIDFLIKRSTDMLVARFQIGRDKFDGPAVANAICAFHSDPQQFAKLILFLA